MGIVIGFICFCLAGLQISQVIKGRKKSNAIQSWLPVAGEVVDNKQEREPKGDVDSNLLQILAYKYQIDGIEYTSSIKFNYENFLGLNRWVSTYEKGDEVDVLYNPNNPQESTLKYYNQDILYEPLGYAFIFILIGIITSLSSLETL